MWATLKAMAQLFGVGVPAISKHLGHIFDDGELDKEVVVSKMEITTQYSVLLYHFSVFIQSDFHPAAQKVLHFYLLL